MQITFTEESGILHLTQYQSVGQKILAAGVVIVCILSVVGFGLYLTASGFTLTCIRGTDSQPDCQIVHRIAGVAVRSYVVQNVQSAELAVELNRFGRPRSDKRPALVLYGTDDSVAFTYIVEKPMAVWAEPLQAFLASTKVPRLDLVLTPKPTIPIIISLLLLVIPYVMVRLARKRGQVITFDATAATVHIAPSHGETNSHALSNVIGTTILKRSDGWVLALERRREAPLTLVSFAHSGGQLNPRKNAEAAEQRVQAWLLRHQAELDRYPQSRPESADERLKRRMHEEL